MIETRSSVIVLASILLCLGFSNITDILAEEPKTKTETTSSPDTKGGKLVGILTHFEYNWTKVNAPKPDMRLSLKAEGESEPVDYLLALPNDAVDPKFEVTLRKVFPSNTVTMQWEMRSG